jgi:uncharacterized protein YktB (UPF0637 family)
LRLDGNADEDAIGTEELLDMFSHEHKHKRWNENKKESHIKVFTGNSQGFRFLGRQQLTIWERKWQSGNI